MADVNLYPHSVLETAVDSGDGLTFNLHGYSAQGAPAPVVYSNGVVVAPAGYTFHVGSTTVRASVTFTLTQAGNTITVTYTWKLTGTDTTDLTAYEVAKNLNVRSMTDANGRDMVVRGYLLTDKFKVRIEWAYEDETFYDEIKWIVEAGYTFDLERPSLIGVRDKITNMYALTYPSFGEIPGVPGHSNFGIDVQQVS